jgi:hypothetical protein
MPHESRDAEVFYEGSGLLIVGKDESIYLESNETDRPTVVVVAGFYGGPAAAAVDDEVRWCVSVGWTGAVIYSLKPPWTDYIYRSSPNDQWWDIGQESGWSNRFIAVQYEGENRFRLESGEDSIPSGSVVLDAQQRTWQASNA